MRTTRFLPRWRTFGGSSPGATETGLRSSPTTCSMSHRCRGIHPQCGPSGTFGSGRNTDQRNGWRRLGLSPQRKYPGARNCRPRPKTLVVTGGSLTISTSENQIAEAWTRRQAAAIKAADPDALVTVGLIQWSVPALLPGVQHYSAFRPERLTPYLDFQEIHFYPLATGFFIYDEDGERRNLAYLESVVREVSATRRPVVIAEFGWYGGGKLSIADGRHPAASEDQQARWCRLAVETTKGLVTGWLNWGFYDHPEARDVSQLTGLLTVEGKPKAWASEFRQLASSFEGSISSRSRSPTAPNWIGTARSSTLPWAVNSGSRT